jgi:hypothetical protein
MQMGVRYHIQVHQSTISTGACRQWHAAWFTFSFPRENAMLGNARSTRDRLAHAVVDKQYLCGNTHWLGRTGLRIGERPLLLHELWNAPHWHRTAFAPCPFQTTQCGGKDLEDSTCARYTGCLYRRWAGFTHLSVVCYDYLHTAFLILTAATTRQVQILPGLLPFIREKSSTCAACWRHQRYEPMAISHWEHACLWRQLRRCM